MNKFIKLIMAFAISACLGLLASCSGASQPTADEVNSKILSGEELEMADYEVMLDYLEDFVKDGESGPNTYERGQQLGRRYPYFLNFAHKLDKAPGEMKQDSHYRDVTRRFIRLMNN